MVHKILTKWLIVQVRNYYIPGAVRVRKKKEETAAKTRLATVESDTSLILFSLWVKFLF